MEEQLPQLPRNSSAVNSRKNGWNYSVQASFLPVNKIIMHWLHIFSYLFLKLDHGSYRENR